jgi:tetraacyldisaccharide 4'-kinase
MSAFWLQSAIERMWMEEAPSPIRGRPALNAASKIYSLLARARARLYDSGVLTVRRLPLPVVSVGNLTVGGSGKTPVVVALARILSRKGLRVCIISRGYKRRKNSPLLRVSDGQGTLCRLREAGDEPFMIAKMLRGVEVWVGKDRCKVGLEALRCGQIDVFLLDDGFQYRGLYRDVDILVMRAPRPFGNGRLLPLGPLREPQSEALRAHLWILNVTEDPQGGITSMEVLRGLSAEIPIVRSRLTPLYLWRLDSHEKMELEGLEGKEVGIICGIGRPKGLLRLVESLGARVAHCLSYPDHHWYNLKDLRKIEGLIKKASIWITTEKDAWKLKEAMTRHGGIWVLATEMILEDEEILNGLFEDSFFQDGMRA